MDWPFVVLGLPRSRTAWLARWLAGPQGDVAVGHDLALLPGVDSVSRWLDQLWNHHLGTVETAAGEAHELLRTAMPGVRLVTLRRPLPEILGSLQRLGLEGLGLELELDRRASALDAAEALGATRIEWSALNDCHCAAWLWEHLRGTPFPFDWWQYAIGQNWQVDWSASQERVRSPEVLALRADLAHVLEAGAIAPGWCRVGWETWDSLWPDAREMAAEHWRLVGAHGGHQFDVDSEAMQRAYATGGLKIISARTNGRLVGYQFWTIGLEPELRGLLQAEQGPWYSEQPGVGLKMLRWAKDRFRELGVATLYPHLPATPEGERFGKVLERLGARPYQLRYCIDLELSHG